MSAKPDSYKARHGARHESTVEASMGEVRRLLDWAAYIAEHEYTPAERDCIRKAGLAYAAALDALAQKYID